MTYILICHCKKNKKKRLRLLWNISWTIVILEHSREWAHLNNERLLFFVPFFFLPSRFYDYKKSKGTLIDIQRNHQINWMSFYLTFKRMLTAMRNEHILLTQPGCAFRDNAMMRTDDSDYVGRTWRIRSISILQKWNIALEKMSSIWITLSARDLSLPLVSWSMQTVSIPGWSQLEIFYKYFIKTVLIIVCLKIM